MKTTRRKFLGNTLLGAAGLGAIPSGMMASATSAAETPVDMPEGGQRYKATVPDSLDLVEFANHGINGLTQNLDPAFNYEIFFRVELGTNPPYFEHDSMGITSTNPKYGESLPMMRVMSGSDRYADIDRKMMQMMLDNTAEDGLYYSHYDPRRTWHEGVGHNYNREFHRDFANPYGNSRLLLAMIAWFAVDRDPAWEPRMEKLAHALGSIAIVRDDYAYYPDSQIGEAFSYAKGLGWLRTEEPMVEHTGAEGSMFMYHCGSIRALARYYALTGDKQSLEDAARLVRFVKLPKFWGVDWTKVEGAGTSAERAEWQGHPHAHQAMLRALLEFAQVTNDSSLKNFVRNGYEFGRAHYGLPRIGMFGEGCSNADMTALSIMLSDAGVGDYWDDTDMYVRNHLVESMYTDPASLRALEGIGPTYEPKPPQDTTDNIVERAIGLVGCPGLTYSIPSSAGCCTGNVTESLYYVWESVVRNQAGTAAVNLLLNRASPWLDVDSYLPYEGKVVIRNKACDRVSIRIPSWVDRSQLRVRVNDRAASPVWLGNFILLENLKTQDTLTLLFPVEEHTEQYTYHPGIFGGLPDVREGGLIYTLKFRGNTLVDVTPREDRGFYPIYQRDHYKQTAAPMREVTRYVAPKLIKWWSGAPVEKA
jgi:hypothetical protein